MKLTLSTLIAALTIKVIIYCFKRNRPTKAFTETGPFTRYVIVNENYSMYESVLQMTNLTKKP